MPTRYELLRDYRASIGAPWFTAPFDLNLLIGRSEHVGAWDDIVFAAFTDTAGRQVVEAWPATGDAWAGEWTQPSHPDGALWILDGHVPGGYEPGQHKGRPALRQRKPFAYVRWPPDAGTVPTVAQLVERGATAWFTANRYTNLHDRVSGNTPAAPAPDDSEGCPVLLYRHHRAALLQLVEEQAQQHGTSRVSPTFFRIAKLPC